MTTNGDRFWETTDLASLDEAQWEALCDGCARCCLQKLADADTGDVYYTDVACGLLDIATCRCTDYSRRRHRMPACIQLTPERVLSSPWLPATCAYRLRALGRPLPRWHHLISGNRNDVHASGASIRGKAVSMADPTDADLMARVIEMVQNDTGCRLFLPPPPSKGGRS